VLLVCLISSHALQSIVLRKMSHRFSPTQPHLGHGCRSVRVAGALSGISLDKSLLPKPVPFLKALPIILLLVLIPLIKSLNEGEDDMGEEEEEEEEDKWHIIRSMVGEVGARMNSLKGRFSGKFAALASLPRLLRRVGAYLNALRKRLMRVEEPDLLNLESWNVCKLTQVTQVDEAYSQYRFDLPYHPDCPVQLDVGQELTLCSVDAKGRTLKEGFFPINSPSAKGYFEIICRNGGYVAGDQFALALQFMSPGDELAVKAGRRRMRFLAPDDPITSISLVASGLGVAPALQLLYEVLPDGESTVQALDLLWINEAKRDFLLNEQVEDLELAYGDLLHVTRVVDSDAHNADTVMNGELRRAVAPYSYGSIAVLLAPETLLLKLRLLLVDQLGYPEQNIVSVVYK